jgi:hypothetical protein
MQLQHVRAQPTANGRCGQNCLRQFRTCATKTRAIDRGNSSYKPSQKYDAMQKLVHYAQARQRNTAKEIANPQRIKSYLCHQWHQLLRHSLQLPTSVWLKTSRCTLRMKSALCSDFGAAKSTSIGKGPEEACASWIPTPHPHPWQLRPRGSKHHCWPLDST